MYKTLSAPLTAQIEITRKCNNECLHCYNFWRQNKSEKPMARNMSPEQIKIVIQKFSNAKIFNITITGGEPLLNKKGLIACLKEAKRLNIGANINSNLVALNEKYLKELKSVGVKSFLTSILGPTAEIHDEITQRKGSFDSLIKNILLCKKKNIHITPNMVISKLNINYIRQTAELISSLGIKTFVATKASCPGNCNDFSKLSLTLEEFREYLETLYKVGQELSMKVDVLESYPLCGIKEIKRYEVFTGRKCLAGITTFTIANDGNVRPCSHLDVSYGNIFHEEISDIWQKMEGWRNGEFMPKECKECKLFAMCGGGCRMESKMINKSFHEMDPYSEIANVGSCFQYLGEKTKESKGVKVKSFTLNKIAFREESFGSIVAVGRSRTFLDHKGTKIFKQLERNIVYTPNDSKINWFGLNPHSFIYKLSKKGVVSLAP